jgi:hypothetical protein
MRRDYAAALAMISELEVRDAANECGYRGLGELLRDVLRISPRDAKRRIQHAHAVTEVALVSGGTVHAPLPLTAVAVRDGVLGAEHLDVIGKALSGLPSHVLPEQREAAERILVQAGAELDGHTLARVGARVRTALDQDGAPPAEAELAHPVNELRFTTRRNGRLAFSGELEPEAGALLQAVLSPLAKPRPSSAAGPDLRSAAERHGDALVDIVQLAANSDGLPSEAGEKPHVLVTVPLRALRDDIRSAPLHGLGGLDGAGGLDGVGGLDAASARRIACDSKVIPAVLGSASEPLDIGRASYTVSVALRRALVLRDQGCAFPGCDRSYRWCHSHHIRHWVDGGRTALDNLLLLCGLHHRLIHHSDWKCAIVRGRAEFYPPAYVDPRRRPRANPVHPRVA